MIDREDLSDENELCQSKSTRGKTINVSLADLKKLIHRAREIEKIPVLALTFVERKNIALTRVFIVVPVEVWKEKR